MSTMPMSSRELSTRVGLLAAAGEGLLLSGYVLTNEADSLFMLGCVLFAVGASTGWVAYKSTGSKTPPSWPVMVAFVATAATVAPMLIWYPFATGDQPSWLMMLAKLAAGVVGALTLLSASIGYWVRKWRITRVTEGTEASSSPRGR